MSVQVRDKTAGDADGAGDSFDLLDFYPEACPGFLVRSWLDCLMWTLGSEEPNFLEAFTRETGILLPRLARNPIEAMIDQATGHTPAAQMRAFMQSYLPWFNANVWGDVNAPAEECAA